MLNPNLLPSLAGGASITGEMEIGQVEELRKALTAGYGTDVANLTDGSALRIQSLERTMMATIQENEHFRLFNALMKSNAGATVDEWTEQNSVGGFLGGSTNSETGVIASAQGSYKRRVGMVKYLMTRREVSFVMTLGNQLVSAEAAEAANGALQLLTDAEFLSFEGDSSVVGTEFDGIYTQIRDGVASGDIDGNHILDARAKSLASVHSVMDAAAIIAGYGNFGKPTDIFMSMGAQADFDKNLDPAYRVSLSPTGQDMMIGAPVVGIRTSQGNIKTQADVFVRDQDQLVPFQLLHPAVATANTGLKPSVAHDSAANSDASSMFGAAEAGGYYYLITGLNAAGQSDGVISTQVTVASGKKVVLTITASAGGQETGYAIYRSRKDGTNAVSDFRLMARIPKAGATTTYTDLNRDIPGTTKAYILNMTPGHQAITWRQLLPMMKFPLYPTQSAVIPWAQLLFGYLRIAKRKHHVVIKNVLPSNATWKPFG